MLNAKDSLDFSNDPRLLLMKQWIESELNLKNYQIETASADASFRRYFRLRVDNKTWIVMDAPPEKEDCGSFLSVAKLIESAGVHAPHIESFNAELGFMQISDLGSTAYLDVLSEDTADVLYQDAIRAIASMQSIKADLPGYDKTLLSNEMALFKDWFLQQHLGITLNTEQTKIWQNLVALLTQSALEQPVVFVHRDYHSRNLMLVNENNPGVIDFQDAVNGPASYDLVSLIKDCYIAWPRHKQLQWIDYFLQHAKLEIDASVFTQQLDWMGFQRHLKAIGIFARLNHRDGKPGYLNDIPRTLAYVVDICRRYEAFSDFYTLIETLPLKADMATLERIV